MTKSSNNKNILKKNSIVSVIVPVFNDEKRIARCIESVINQSYSNFELLIIDDGSKDSSARIANNFALKDGRIKLISSSNKGPSSARNIGIRKSIGEFIFFLDSDDYLENYSLEPLVDKILGKKNDLVIGDFISINNQKIQSKNSSYFSKSTNLNIIETNNYVSLYLKRPNKYPLFVYSWGRIFKSSIIKTNNVFFNEKLRTFEDVDFNFRYLIWVNNIFFLKKVVINHIISNNFSSETMRIPENPSQFFGFKESLQSVHGYLSKFNINNRIGDEIAHAYVSYTIIQIIRLSLQHSVKTDKVIRKLISDSVNDSILQKNLSHYSPSIGDSKLIPILIKLKLSWLLLNVCKLRARARYKPKKIL